MSDQSDKKEGDGGQKPSEPPPSRPPEPRPAKPPPAMDVSTHSQKPDDVVIGPVFELETGREVGSQEED